MVRLSLASLVPLALVLGCAAREQRLEHVPVRSAAMNDVWLDYAVYTPPDFRPDERLPLVLFLHGGGDEPANFEKYGVAQRLDQAITEGRAPRAVVVLPRGDNGFWINWWDGSRRYEDWILDELLPEVQRDYHTAPCPEGCHVMGVSMGGAGTLRFALRYPERFRTATVLSAPIFDTKRMLEFVDRRLYGLMIPTRRIFGPPRSPAQVAPDDPFLAWQEPGDVELSLFIGWAAGDRDGIKESNQALTQHLRDHGISHHAEEFEGEHKWTSWSPVIERAMVFQVANGGVGD